MSRLLKGLLLALAIVAVAALSIIAASCNSSNTQARFVNAVSDAAALDFDFNGTKIFSDLPPNTASSSTYVGVPAGTDQIQGFATGTATSAFPKDAITLNSGSFYTLVAAGLSNGTVNILNPLDNNTAPANGSVNFRVINASSYGPYGGGVAADVYILPNPNPCQPGNADCPATISNLAYQSTSSYVTLPYNSEQPLTWQIIVTVAGHPTTYFNDTLGGVGSASEGAICTLVLTDEQGGTEMNTLPLKLNDLNCAGL